MFMMIKFKLDFYKVNLLRLSAMSFTTTNIYSILKKEDAAEG